MSTSLPVMRNFGVFEKLQCLVFLENNYRLFEVYLIFNIPPSMRQIIPYVRSLQEKVETVDRGQQLRVKQAKLADEGGRGRGRGRGKGRGKGRGNRPKQVEEQGDDGWGMGASWEDWYHSEWDWDYEHGCWWWEVRDKPRGSTKEKKKEKPRKETKVKAGKEAKEPGKETKVKATGSEAKELGKETKVEVTGKKAKVEKAKVEKDETENGANGKKRKAANQVEAEQDGSKATRTRERTSAPASSSKEGKKKKSKSQGKESMSVPMLEQTPKDREGQILMLKTFALNFQHIKEDSLPVRQELRDQLPPLQTCQLNIYWGEGRASCGLKHVKQGKNFGLYNFLNRDTEYINKMAVAIKAAHMLAPCFNSTILLCLELPYVPKNTVYIINYQDPSLFIFISKSMYFSSLALGGSSLTRPRLSTWTICSEEVWWMRKLTWWVTGAWIGWRRWSEWLGKLLWMSWVSSG